MWRDELRGIYYIALKDMETYYFKPPAVSWGIFPVVWILAFYLRNPGNFEELIPGLIAMTILFSTTAAEAVVINFELKLGSLERPLLAPVSIASVLIGKVLGGFIFGLLMTIIVALLSTLYLGVRPNVLMLALVAVPSLLVFSSMGAFFSVAVKEVFEAQTLLNLPRFIMIFLCGVIYPVSAMPEGLQYLARLMPLTYTVNGISDSFSPGSTSSIFLNSSVMVGYFLILIIPSIKMLNKKFE
ncbi:ABC-type multidrug transport system, permease component [Methanosarcina siciliae HI350]|uniref:ABC-type multidrug transport system, permease component n=1 Tax=Methanosarcina siciliae HI350 TaxID=1434119 RepID=A0A0E3PHK9_9EURY|nr:ABC transporter permease [Methanosarcina siciliae]AKB33985.1 ABC-type multidrug transport system, permease component [Methanosarcina siciliae HI350]